MRRTEIYSLFPQHTRLLNFAFQLCITTIRRLITAHLRLQPALYIQQRNIVHRPGHSTTRAPSIARLQHRFRYPLTPPQSLVARTLVQDTVVSTNPTTTADHFSAREVHNQVE
jgi:hypothetical protein